MTGVSVHVRRVRESITSVASAEYRERGSCIESRAERISAPPSREKSLGGRDWRDLRRPVGNARRRAGNSGRRVGNADQRLGCLFVP